MTWVDWVLVGVGLGFLFTGVSLWYLRLLQDQKNFEAYARRVVQEAERLSRAKTEKTSREDLVDLTRKP